MPDDILRFWFDETKPAQWWKVDPAFDAAIAQRFGALHAAAVQGELSGWRGDAAGRLAEVIVLDQFSRNIHRGAPGAFAADPMALVLAQEAVAAGHDLALPPERRVFLYMPFMHSESRRVHEEAERLFTALGIQNNLDFERRHKAIIERFGRYPHRNAILGRVSSDEELAFLKTPGSSF
ncbi:MAG TPA: DUF924 family protein [Variovorax sp.]|jgi:uncharacterized protein (DUF924 family)|nr:DUF924 family protein [Variovorax sp.]